MTEGEVIEQLINFTNIVLAGLSVLFTVVSSYIVALNYFIGSASVTARIASFIFVSLVLVMLVFVMIGAQSQQAGLIERLRELDHLGRLTAAGRSALHNADGGGAHATSIDDVVKSCIWIGLGFVYVALAYLTFLHKWRPDAIAVSIEPSRDA